MTGCGRRVGSGLIAVIAFAIAAGGAQAQTRFAPDAFLDPVARALYEAAFDGWNTLDESVVRYTARIDQRIAAAIRMPLRDRVVYHNETAVRAFWERDYDPVVQVLGSRSEYPGREIAMREGDLGWLEDLPFDEPFEPGSDHLFLGMGNDPTGAEPTEGDYNLIHPLGPGADTVYRFQSGDTLAVSFSDGRRLRATQLDVLPREASARRISGVLWIQPETGALVRATYRLSREFDAIRDIPELQEEDEAGEFRFVPGILRPWTFNLNVVAVDYTLWDFKAWLPRSMRLEGEVAAGILKLPVSMDMAYRVESVVMQDDLDAAQEGEPTGQETVAADDMREVHFATRAEAMDFIAALLAEDDRVPYELMSETPARERRSLLIVPEELSRVAESAHLPPPIWEAATGFTDVEALEAHVRDLADLPALPVQLIPWSFDWGWAHSDLVRYNRVEGPAVGGRLRWDLSNRYAVNLKGSFGFADLRPKARAELERSTVLRRLTLGAYHEMQDAQTHGLRFGTAFAALLWGRDDGEYFRATGVDLTWRPPEGSRESFQFRAYAERHGALANNTDFVLFRVFDDDWRFRPNLAADEAEEAGAELRLSPWWGHDPLKAQFGLELEVRSAVWRSLGDEERREYAQASATARAVIPLRGNGWTGWRLGVEAAGGNTWGAAPVQRSWFLGSASTLRGYPASVASGPSFVRGRLEASRYYHGVAGSVFSDVGWAGAAADFDGADLLASIGIGGSVLDGLFRLDMSRGLRGPLKEFRIEFYLDGIL